MTQPRKNTKRERTAMSVRDADVIGRLQPQAVYMEEAVLGAMMLDRNAIMQVIEMLRVDTFYDERHQLVFQAIKNLVDRTEPVDILTVTAELRKIGIAGSCRRSLPCNPRLPTGYRQQRTWNTTRIL